ncbi:MAG TPA: hypothetical protein VHT93_11415 [Pseudolabrys sp.]|jgi:hypothetical protein|nr:hypothetical protein [Pseudolabrys sp.]
MDKRIAGLLGAAAAVTALSGVQANAAPAQAASYADLLQPVPNAVSALQADDERRAAEPEARVQLAQYHHHHHWRRTHHHHHHWRRHYHHHHHHAGFGVYVR